ncbi:ankyrin/TPR repeat protein [Strigomonas culicis]|uniref:Ankyrin/TPR repeat protein n=1 Tax=Strigomonas culicis TaxID=28005 RepID=S9WKE9_9TRYP|nr:ankyrin/TPR repeat protein [Strigomonas culicis]|eukprot:EPY36460.1 ankyrin/TPR repeat protein [Strigomonas culicis]
MDDGTRISEDVEKFLRAAKAGEIDKCSEMLKSSPELIDCQEAGGYCALHFAASTGNCGLIRMLCGAKANINLENYDENPPIVIAIKCHQLGALQELLSAGANVHWQSSKGITAAHHAVAEGDLKYLELLVSKGAKTAFKCSEAGTLLHWACHSGSVDCVGAMLYDYHIDVNVTDKFGGTPLMTAVFLKKREVFQFLLDSGANASAAVGEDGTTPLHLVVDLSLNDYIRPLCNCGADPHAKNKEGLCAIDLATTAKNASALKELQKEKPSKAQRSVEAEKYKAQGNKCFEKREYMKAIKFYSLAIQLDNLNHVYFSNRALCYFNQQNLLLARWDAERCIALNQQWFKGYLRKAMALSSLKKYAEALEAVDEGLRLNGGNRDLLDVKQNVNKAEAG